MARDLRVHGIPMLHVHKSSPNHVCQSAGDPTEVDDVVSSIRVDREQMSAVWNRALLLVLHTTPLQQFGIGFGVGW